ncbi:glycine oxidase ThiO [soil metagenome]
MVVIGAGVVGLSCAWRLARSGARVRVLERGEAGSGATGVAAGMIAPVGESNWGEEALVAEALRSHAAWPQFARELADDAGTDPGLTQCGALHVALDRDELAELRRRFDLTVSLGLEASWRRSREARKIEPSLSPGVVGAIHAPSEAAIDPPTLIGALLAAAKAFGAEVIESCEVVEAILDGERLTGVRDREGIEHRAPVSVIATGAWSGAAGWLPERARPAVRPVKGQILVLRDRSGRAACGGIVASERVYLVPRGDGRVIVGATVEEMGFDTTVTAGGVHELLREAYRAMPEVAEMELVACNAGLRPGTPDNAPLVGPGELEGLIVATGHYRHGVLLGPVTAERVVELAGSANSSAGESLAGSVGR